MPYYCGDGQAKNPCVLAGQSGTSQGVILTSTLGGSIWGVNVSVQQGCMSAGSISKIISYTKTE